MGNSRRGKRRKAGRRSNLNVWWLIGGLAAVLIVGAVGVSVYRGVIVVQQSAELELPAWVRSGSEKVQSSYAAATLHAEELQYIPCYCGCGGFGHASVIDCFISGTDASGAPIYADHAYY
jgi:hypothetical protein